MPTTTSRTAHKHFRLDNVKLKLAQKALDAATETETVERALELVITEHERNHLVAEANRKFVKSGIAVRDVYGVMQD